MRVPQMRRGGGGQVQDAAKRLDDLVALPDRHREQREKARRQEEDAETIAEQALERSCGGPSGAGAAFQDGALRPVVHDHLTAQAKTHSLALIRPIASMAPTVHFVSHIRHSRPHCGGASASRRSSAWPGSQGPRRGGRGSGSRNAR
jgi:hypothetical protein